MSDTASCTIELDIAEPKPSLIDMGAAFPLVLALTPQADIDLCGARCIVRDGERLVWEGTLPPIKHFDPNSDDYDPRNGSVEQRDCASLMLTAPATEGEFTWTVVLPAQEICGANLAEATTRFTFCTGRHKTSLSVWDVASPVVSGATLTLKIGAKCTAGCNLTGHWMAIVDAGGAPMAAASLGNADLPDAEGLHWTEVAAPAPESQGLHEWNIRFDAGDLALPHQGAGAAFSFMVMPPPQHRVSVTVVESETQAPVAQAQVRLGDIRLATDDRGRVIFDAPSGRQRLFVWEAEHAIPEQFVDVDRDLEIAVEATALPKKDPYDRWDG